jgi:hypothetical protein
MNYSKLKWNLTLQFLVLLSLQFAGCGGSKKIAVNKTKINDQGKPNPSRDEKPTFTCESQWNEFSTLQPQGRQTTYQEIQTININGSATIVSQSISQKTITENTGDKISWNKETNDLIPRVGQTTSHTSMLKEVFIDLCSKGVNFTYKDRPRDFKPTLQEQTKLIVREHEYEVQHEKYVFTKNNSQIDKDELDLWIGIKAPYIDLLFKSQRKIHRSSGSPSETIEEKELKDFKD